MTNIKLFRTTNGEVKEIKGESAALEKSLQNQIERNLFEFLGVRFLASEYFTGKTHGGRIDSLGIDENNCPVVIEYKKAITENVINQGLFYLSWLQDHKAEFELLVLRTLGQEVSNEISWDSPRLICIAGGFTKYDEHAVNLMNVNIDLISYKRFGEDLLIFEQVHVSTAENAVIFDTPRKRKTVSQKLNDANQELKDVFETLKDMMLDFGDDVQMNETKVYFGFRRLFNFAHVKVKPQANKILAYVRVNPDDIPIEEGFTKDMRSRYEGGSGFSSTPLEITITTIKDLEKARPLIQTSYENS